MSWELGRLADLQSVKHRLTSMEVQPYLHNLSCLYPIRLDEHWQAMESGGLITA